MLRPILVFAVVFGVLAGIAAGPSLGDRLIRPSKDNHFVHLANSWLHGRLDHDGYPSGYCTPQRRKAKKCKQHRHDDWGRVTTLELRDGTALRAYPCKTQVCRDARRERRVETWWVIGQGWTELSPGDVQGKRDSWYVTFPPGPAVVMLPFAAAMGTGVPDVLITVFIAALIPVVLLRLLDRERGMHEGRGAQHLWIVAAWALASPACLVGANGRVWFTAQIVGALFSVLYLSAGWGARRPTLAGLWLACAVACRPHLAFAVIFFALEWWRTGRKVPALVRFVVPVAVIGGILMWHNAARFEDPFEFGHRFLDIRWQARMQEIGMFSTEYLGRNLQCLFGLMPVLQSEAPNVRVSLHGVALWLSTPWLLVIPLARARYDQRLGLWLSAAAVAVLPLLYQNSGQVQFSYRFAIEFLPMVLLAMAFGGATARGAFVRAVIIALAINIWAAWMFAHRPRDLFVLDPMGWPFEDELKGPGASGRN